MCTVSFIPTYKEDFILTSNRDESPFRKTIAPKVHKFNTVRLMFPKDEVAGGTWIGVSNKKRLICLLNGGFEPHIPKGKYRLSRGVIVTDLLTSENVITKIETYDFNDIEPFTIIMVNWDDQLKLFELVWDGNTKHFSEKQLKPTIWSSSLLYSEEVKKKREHWFSEFINTTEIFSEKNIINFHKNAGEGNIETNLVMDRTFVKTKSITGFSKKDATYSMRYEDLLTQKISLHTL